MSLTAAKPTILVTGSDLAPQAIAILKDYELIYAGKKPTESELIALCQQHNPLAIIVRYGRITKVIIEAAPALKIISKHGSGIDTIDVETAQLRGIKVYAAAGANAVAVAEHTIALMLACAKSIVPLHSRMLEGHWDKSTHKSIELAGKTLGLIGFGAIGSRVAAFGHALEMRVIAYDPFAKIAPEGVTLMELKDVFQQADVLSLHCPLTEQNRAMINATTLASMKKSAILINTARGGLIDEASLIQVLKTGKLHAAGLDSFVAEPLENAARFHNIPNLILSPHIGGVSHEAYVKMGVGAAQNIINHL